MNIKPSLYCIIFLFLLFGCSKSGEASSSTVCSEPLSVPSSDLSVAEAESTSESSTLSSSSELTQYQPERIPISESKYFSDCMPQLSLEEKKMIDLPVPAHYLDEFECYECFPHNPLENGLTYGELWRYIGDDGTIILGNHNPRILQQLKSVRRVIGYPSDTFDMENICKMTWLKELSLKGGGGMVGGGLWNFPEEIKSLTELTHLSIVSQEFNDNITTYPDIFDSFKKLEYLDLSQNSGIQLPPSVFRLRNLKELHLSGGQLTSLSKQIGQLKNLRVLTLDMNPLSEIPDEICELTQLEELWFNATVPGYQGDIYPDPVNVARTLPRNIGNLSKLRDLRIEYFPISELPESLCELKNLETLIIRAPLTNVPENMGNLKYVNDIEIQVLVYMYGSEGLGLTQVIDNLLNP